MVEDVEGLVMFHGLISGVCNDLFEFGKFYLEILEFERSRFPRSIAI